MNSTSDQTVNKLSMYIPKCVTHFREDTVGGVKGTLLITIYTFNMVTILLFNILLIIGICKTRKKNRFTNSNKLFLCLCASDLFTGGVLMPIQIYSIHATPNLTCLETCVRAFWSSFPLLLSGNIILMISVDRYFMMSATKFHKRYFHGSLLLVYLFVGIAVSLGWALGYVYTIKSLHMEEHTIFYISLSIYELIILIAVVVFNVKMLNNVKSMQKQTTLTHGGAERVLSKTITLISIALVISYIPSVIGLSVSGFYIKYSSNRETLKTIVIVLIWSLVPTQINSSLNALIYLLRNSRIRTFYKKLIRGPLADSLTDNTNDSLASHKDTHRVSTKKNNYRTYNLIVRDNNQSITVHYSNNDVTTNSSVNNDVITNDVTTKDTNL